MCNVIETTVVMVEFKWRVEVRRLQIVHREEPFIPSDRMLGTNDDVVFLRGVLSDSQWCKSVAIASSRSCVVFLLCRKSRKDPLGEPRVCICTVFSGCRWAVIGCNWAVTGRNWVKLGKNTVFCRFLHF